MKWLFGRGEEIEKLEKKLIEVQSELDTEKEKSKKKEKKYMITIIVLFSTNSITLFRSDIIVPLISSNWDYLEPRFTIISCLFSGLMLLLAFLRKE